MILQYLCMLCALLRSSEVTGTVSIAHGSSFYNASCNSDGLECSSIKTLEACPVRRGKLLSGPEQWLCDDCIVFWCSVFVPNWFTARLLTAYPSAQYKECRKKNYFLFSANSSSWENSNRCPSGRVLSLQTCFHQVGHG